MRTRPLKKTIGPLAADSPSLPGTPRTAFSSWSRTRRNTRPRVAGDTHTLTTANWPTTRCSRPASPATKRSVLATSCLPVTPRSQLKAVRARDREPKRRSGPVVRRRRQAAPVALDDRAAHGQAEPHTVAFGRVESFEQPFDRLGVEPNSGVAHGQPP